MRRIHVMSTMFALALCVSAAPAAQASYADPVITVKLTFSKLVAGKTVLLPASAISTDINAGSDLYSDSKSICTVTMNRKGYSITAIKPGTCQLRAYMPGMKGKFPSATKRFTVPVVKG